MADTDKEEQILQNRKAAIDHQKEWRQNARMWFDFYANRQYSDDEMAELEEALRPAITFNRIGPVVDAVSGHQINNQQDIKYHPRELTDDPYAEVYNMAMRWADDESDALDDIADAFFDMVISGVGVTEAYMSYDEEPEGKFYPASHVPCMEMGWDPAARKRNITDAQFVFRDKYFQEDEAKQRWPEINEYMLALDDTGIVDDSVQEPHDASEAWKYENDAPTRYWNPKRREIKITQYQEWEHKPIYRVSDRQSGKVIELTERKFKRMQDSLDMMQVPYVRQMKRTYRQYFIIGRHILEEEELPANDFTFKFMTGKRDTTRNLWFGIVAGMIDPQKWSNKFFAEIQDFMASNRRGGTFAESDAFADPRKAEEDWNENNPLILLNPGGINKIRERQQNNYPQGLDRLMELAIAAIPDTSGINLEMLGMVDRNQPGVVESQRKRASINILSNFFKSLKKYQRERGRLGLFYIQNYLSDGRLIKIVGQQREQLVRLTKNPNHDVKYDIIVDESPHSVNQKEETFGVLMNLLPFLVKLGFPPPPDLMEYLPLPKTLTMNWKQAMAQGQQAQQAATQLEQQREQVNIQDIASRSEKNKAQAREMLAKAQKAQASIGQEEMEQLIKLLN